MTAVFVDTSHFVAVFNPGDQWHEHAGAVEQHLRAAQRVTTELVLVEVLNFFSAYREDVKSRVARAVGRWLASDKVETVLRTHDAFLGGFEFYRSRIDKGYSLTDCISMNLMRELGVDEVLTYDRHFAQEGFRIVDRQS